MASVTVNGVTYTDDDNASTGLANGGHRTRLVPMFGNAVTDLLAKQTASAASAATATTQANNAAGSASTASTQAGIATTKASEGAASAAAAAASVLASQSYATLAQATNPDAPVRLNPRIITADLAIASAYNANSTGPITVSEGITVTVGDNATWSIH